MASSYGPDGFPIVDPSDRIKDGSAGIANVRIDINKVSRKAQDTAQADRAVFTQSVADINEELGVKVSTDDPRLPLATEGEVTHAWADPAGKSPFYATTDGHVHAPLPVIAPAVGVYVEGMSAGTYDPGTGRMAENVIDEYGLVPQWVLDSWASRMNLGGVRTAGVALTCSAGSNIVDTATSAHVRYPFRVAPKVNRMRVHLRNYNDRDAVSFGSVSVTGLWWGQGAQDSNGLLTGAFKTTPIQISEPITVQGSTETVTPWIDVDTIPRGEYLLSLGYTSPAQNNHYGVGGCWRSTASGEASQQTPTTTMSQDKYAPLDVWIEVEVSADTPVFAAGPGDSLTAGTASTLPVYDSWGAKHALAIGGIAQLYANHGSTLQNWGNSAQWKYQKYANLSKPDAALISVGSNSVFNGNDLATCQTALVAVVAAVRQVVCEQIFYANLLPRNTGTDSAKEAVRVSYNDYLDQLPHRAVMTFNFAGSIADPTNVARVDARWLDVDGVHLKSSGYARNAASITQPLA